MKSMHHYRIFIFAALLSGTATGSGCTGYLDAKPEQRMFIPTKATDLQALLDNFLIMNQKDPYAGDLSADDYYMTQTNWNGRPEHEQRMYTWAPDFIFRNRPNEWSDIHQPLFIANTVLANADKLPETEKSKPLWGFVRGQALFHRARVFLSVATIWAPAYDLATAQDDLGVALRLTEDFNEPSIRASVSDSYKQIIDDLREAVGLLPQTEVTVLRPTKTAAYALLARTYLAMREYGQARLYADSAYRLGPPLMDFRSLNLSSTRPFAVHNPEVVFHAQSTLIPGHLAPSRAFIDTLLLASYQAGDLRRVLFFQYNSNGTVGFKGHYSGMGNLFSGIASDEIYLMKAECEARAGNISEAMGILTALMKNRWVENAYVPPTVSTKDEALAVILAERRKELVFRGLRWMDIKRLNKDGHGIELTRQLGDTRYELPPNDPRYALAIPEEVIRLSDMPQNRR